MKNSLNFLSEQKNLNGRYTIKDKLGSGITSKVFECLDNQTGESKAIKIYRDEERLIFKKEMKIMQKISEINSSSHIKLYESGNEFLSEERKSSDFRGFGYDIDKKALKIAEENAIKAGIDGYIRFESCDIRDFSCEFEKCIIITNPPYGERLLDVEQAQELYKIMGERFVKRNGLSYTIITPDEDFEHIFGRRADKRRKLYNGMIKCQVYIYFKD